MKTISTGIRIPEDLYKLVKSVEPDIPFSHIVVRALVEKYDFVDSDSDIVHGEPDIDVDSLVERMFQNVHKDKDVP